jgi:hypothetical protein
MKQAWKKYLLYGSGIVVGGILLLILIETIRAKNTGFETKTLWDWMELLVIPLVLAGGAFYLNRSERNLERQIVTDRQQEAALQAYLDRMAELLLKEKLLTPENEAAWNVARVRTLTVLRGLDSTRNAILFRFLKDISLAGNKESNFLVYANLEGVDLENVDLSYTNLYAANLNFANLRGASFEDAILQGASLRYANLQAVSFYKTNLQGAILWYANLYGASLVQANLQGADLSSANLNQTQVDNDQLESAESLKGATMPDGTKHD